MRGIGLEPMISTVSRWGRDNNACSSALAGGGFQPRQQIQHFVFRKEIQQSLRHERGGSMTLGEDFGFRNFRELVRMQWVFSQLQAGGAVIEVGHDLAG